MGNLCVRTFCLRSPFLYDRIAARCVRHVPHRRMGQAAARVLLAIRDGTTQSEGIELETSVVVRESLGGQP